MTALTKKQYQTLVTLLVIIIAIGIGLLAVARVNYLNAKEKEQIAYESKKKSIERLYYEVKSEYDYLKGAPVKWWNESYAQLTLNRTRDTVIHPDYTVKEFVKYHRGLMILTDYFKRHNNVLMGFNENQVLELFPYKLEVQHLIGTMKVKKQFLRDAETLEGYFQDIINKTKPTDSVVYKHGNRDLTYKPYFGLLGEMDKAIYDLISYRYSNDLLFLGNIYPDVIERAKDILLSKQVGTLLDSYYMLKNEKINPENGVRLLANEVASDTTITLFKAYENSNKTLVAAYTEKDIYPLSDDERIAFLGQLDTLVPKKQNEEKRYYIVDSGTSFYYASDTNKVLYPHVLENDDAEVLRFYDDDLKRYYIFGEFKAFDLFYPDYEEGEAGNE